MKNIVASVCCAALLALAAVTPVWAAGPTFGQVVDGVDENKNTKFAAKENWKKWKGTEVSWSGVVNNVDTKGKSEVVVYVADKSRPLYKGYNIKVQSKDLEKAATLKKGQTIRFKGTLDDFDTKDAGAIIELKGGTF